MQQLEAFFRTASAFCQWAEGNPDVPEEEASTALRLLSQLCAQAYELPALFDAEDAPEFSHEQWLEIYKRFGTLPFNYYAPYSEPHDTAEPSPGVGDLADDLADICQT